jgi:hypothetical protein
VAAAAITVGQDETADDPDRGRTADHEADIARSRSFNRNGAMPLR